MTYRFAAVSRVVWRAPRAANTLFLDRDGVLNHAVIRGATVSSPRRWEEFRLAEDIEALAASAIRERWNLVVITNQPDLSRGTMNEHLLQRFHDALAERIPLTAVYVCPHTASEGCLCRKPKTGLIGRFRREHPGLGGKELFVGDRGTDLQCAEEAGVPFVLRLRHYNRELRRVAQCIDTLWDLEHMLNGSER